MASARIQAAKSKHKSVEAGLMTAECQVVELTAKLDREYKHASQLWGEISELKNEVNKARAGAQKAEDEAQAYYDQGFDEATNSLKSQLTDECNKYFFQGWRMVENLKRDSVLVSFQTLYFRIYYTQTR